MPSNFTTKDPTSLLPWLNAMRFYSQGGCKRNKVQRAFVKKGPSLKVSTGADRLMHGSRVTLRLTLFNFYFKKHVIGVYYVGRFLSIKYFLEMPRTTPPDITCEYRWHICSVKELKEKLLSRNGRSVVVVDGCCFCSKHDFPGYFSFLTYRSRYRFWSTHDAVKNDFHAYRSITYSGTSQREPQPWIFLVWTRPLAHPSRRPPRKPSFPWVSCSAIDMSIPYSVNDSVDYEYVQRHHQSEWARHEDTKHRLRDHTSPM